MRTSEIRRKTEETDVFVSLDIDGSGQSTVSTGVGFLDHMLILFAKHGRFDLSVKCKGDVDVDDHHSVEDIAIVLGQAFKEALGDRRGINRYGDIILPMDEALILCAVDISGRTCLGYQLEIPTEKVGSFDTELTEEFFVSFVRNLPMSLHLRQLAGTNSHHIIEGAFKAFARALSKAAAIDEKYADEIPSTKGIL